MENLHRRYYMRATTTMDDEWAALLLAADLMRGDPSEYKAGYTRENALIAGLEVFPDARKEIVGRLLDDIQGGDDE
jgi:hypothetical protein